MKILLSPAKTLDFNTNIPTQKISSVCFEAEADILNKVLQTKSPRQLMTLMSISEKLADLNWQRNQDWYKAVPRQSIFAFKGEVYVGLDVYSVKASDYDYMESTVRILSGQYGVLTPFDLIKPYRLEMGTKLVVKNTKNLYEFWDDKITNRINTELKTNEIVVNLASQEYFKSVKPKKLNASIVTPIFKDYKNGKLKVISFYAKKTRGLMTRFAIDNNIKDIQQLKTFNLDNYAFDSSLSNDKEWIFTR